jgi:hypothetical protein
MDRGGWHYPSGDIRASDADRDQALSELRVALRAGRVTADEFDERAGRALAARTGKELTGLLADLPVERPGAQPPAIPERPNRVLAMRVGIGAAAVGATVCGISAIGGALSQYGILQHQEFLRSQLPPLLGGPVPGISAASFNWGVVIAPGVIALLFVVLIVVLSFRLGRASRD